MDLMNTHEYLENDDTCFYTPYEVGMKHEAHKMFRNGHDWAEQQKNEMDQRHAEEERVREQIERQHAEEF